MAAARRGSHSAAFKSRCRRRINPFIACIDALEPRQLLSNTITFQFIGGDSTLQLTGSVRNDEFIPQGVGYGIPEHFIGSIDATITGSSIKFDSATLTAATVRAPAQPLGVQADFALVAQDNNYIDEISGLTSTITSPNVSLSDSDTFPASALTVRDTSGTLDYAQKNDVPYAHSLIRLGSANEAGGTGSLVAGSDGFTTLTIPILLTESPQLFYQPGTTFIFSGTLVAVAGVHLAFSQQPTDVTAGNAINPAVTVGEYNAMGGLVTSNDSDVTLTLRPTSALSTSTPVLNGMKTVAAVNGLATFSDLSVDTVGRYNLMAAGPGSPVVSSDFKVAAAAPASLSFIQQPTSTVAGHDIDPPIVIGVEDEFGNLTTADISPAPLIRLTLDSGPSGATLNDANARPNGGIARFHPISFQRAGNYVLTASYDGLTLNSQQFEIEQGAPAKLIFSPGPSDAIAGSDFFPPVGVYIEDSFFNLVTDDDSVVNLSIAGTSGATLTGTTSLAAVNGAVSFPGLAINTPGTYVLVARSQGLHARSGDVVIST